MAQVMEQEKNKQAKSEAAGETLEVLIPEMKAKFIADKGSGYGKNNKFKDLSIFDEKQIEDLRASEFCSKTSEPLPHATMLKCLQRNFRLGDMKINYEVNTTKYKRNVGGEKYSAAVAWRNNELMLLESVEKLYTFVGP